MKDNTRPLCCPGIDHSQLFDAYSGTANEESDIDLMIVTENEDDYLAGKIWSLTSKVNSKIEPFLIGKTRFYSNDYSPLIDLVKKTGLEVG